VESTQEPACPGWILHQTEVPAEKDDGVEPSKFAADLRDGQESHILCTALTTDTHRPRRHVNADYIMTAFLIMECHTTATTPDIEDPAGYVFRYIALTIRPVLECGEVRSCICRHYDPTVISLHCPTSTATAKMLVERTTKGISVTMHRPSAAA
jgi:hypothetical protein